MCIKLIVRHSFIYGGYDSANGVAVTDEQYLDVYILSLPSFTWFRASAPTESWRANHFCQVIGNRQMLVIGGWDVSSISNFGAVPDPWEKGLGIFDMTSLTWTDGYNVSAARYERPSMVEDYYMNQ